jgi:hypothetical protein
MPDPMSSPRTPAAIERTYDGFRKALATMSTRELLELSAKQAALLEEQGRQALSASLWDYHQSSFDPAGPSTTPPLPAASGREPADPASRGSSGLQPRPPAPSRFPVPRVGRRLAMSLERRGRAANAKRARAEGRR